MKAGRYLKLIGIFAGASVAAKLEYRANFVVNILESVVRAVAGVLGLSILFGDGKGCGVDGCARLGRLFELGVCRKDCLECPSVVCGVMRCDLGRACLAHPATAAWILVFIFSKLFP